MAGVSNTLARPTKKEIKQQVVTANPDPHEWDFRGVNPDHLDAILFYEKERENCDLPRSKTLLTSENRRKIFNLDADAFANDNLETECFGPNPEEYSRLYLIVAVCWLCSEFPKPWMSLNENARAEAARRYKANKWLSGCSNLQVWSRAELAKFEAREEFFRRMVPDFEKNPNSPMRLIIEIDWARADDRALKPLLLNLLKLRPDGIHPRKLSTGKKAAVPVHKLKQLAAWRLKRAGLNYNAALETIEHHRKHYPVADRLDLLPKYGSAGAWSDAVKAGEKLIRGY